MNHFATDRENRRLDEIALQAMERLDPAHLLATVTEHNISMCGVLPAVIVMETLRQLGGLTACERVGYATRPTSPATPAASSATRGCCCGDVHFRFSGVRAQPTSVDQTDGGSRARTPLTHPTL